MRATTRAPKHRQVYLALERDIKRGRWKRGDRLPSEADLVHTFGASRITVGRAMRELQLAGLIDRRAGSGSFVKTTLPAGALSFGLLIPDLGETEIFEPMCQGMMASPLAREHALLWGSLNGKSASKAERALELCSQYVARRVDGVFFAPLELTDGADDINVRIARALDDAGIPIVLLDRTVLPYPRRGHHDLAGIDNRRAGYVVTEHLLRLRRRRIAFVALPHGAPTVDARIAGYREALYAWNAPVHRTFVQRIDPEDGDSVRAMMESSRPDAIVCANDWIASRLMHTLLRLDYAIPRDVALVGIDDVEYASLVPVPLTTLRQPTRQIGEAALMAMLDRVRRKELPARDILLHCELVVRKSCGSEVPTLRGS